MTTSAVRTYFSTVTQLVHYIYAQLKDYGTFISVASLCYRMKPFTKSPLILSMAVRYNLGSRNYIQCVLNNLLVKHKFN